MGHNVVLVALTSLVVCFFIVTLVFNSLGMNSNNGLYRSQTEELSNKYFLEITPSGWTFSIWGFIYTWQALWILYAVVNLFRMSENGPAYTYPVLLSAPYLVSYLVNLACNCGWLVAFDREILELALTLLFLITVTVYTCLVLSYRSLEHGMDTLIKQGRRADIWLTRLLVQNGLSIYAAWCTIATLLNLGVVLSYRSAHVNQEISSTICLSILSTMIILYLVADWFFLDRYTRYTFTPYIVLIVALLGSTAKQFEYDQGSARNIYFAIVLLFLSGLVALVKIVLLIWRHCRRTAYGVRITDTDGVEL